jgi:hypothetical protein
MKGENMDIRDEVDNAPMRARIGSAFDKIESIYLRALRVVILVLATLLVLFAAWLCMSGLWGVARSPTSVTEAPAKVEAAELTAAEMPDAAEASSASPKADPSAGYRKFYADFGGRYFNIYQSLFEPYRQPDDKKLSQSEFVDAYLKVDDRVQAIKDGALNFSADKADLEDLYLTMNEAAKLPQTVQRLQKYKSAKRVQTTKKVQRFRTELQRGWDSYSTSCASWYESPIGCPATRSVQVPYTESVKAMELPKGTQSHAQIFRAFQDKYFELLKDRRDQNAKTAQDERSGIEAANIAGRVSLFTALQVLGGFLLLMFFFLLIAIERHQRRIAVVVD